jgi:hypothetical protein
MATMANTSLCKQVPIEKSFPCDHRHRQANENKNIALIKPSNDRCFQLKCGFGTSDRSLVIKQIHNSTSLRGCAEECANDDQCQASDLVVGLGAANDPNTCVLLSEYSSL